jgi:DNA-binding transcriptional LysR family regulator
MLEAFVREHPAVTLELDLSPRRVDLLAENFDVALRMGNLPDDAQLSARRLAWFSGGLFASPQWVRDNGMPQHPEELMVAEGSWRALAIAGQGGEAAPWRLERPVEGAGAEAAPMERWQGLPARRMLANSPPVLLRMARAGLGLTLAADFFALPYVHAGELVRVLPAWRSPPAAAWAVFPERRLMPAKTRAFIDALAKALEPCREPGARLFTDCRDAARAGELMTGCGEAAPGALRNGKEPG